MELTLRPYDIDLYPVCGFFVEGPRLNDWIAALDEFGLDPQGVELYGLPTREVNRLWGCLVIVSSACMPEDLGRYAAALRVDERLIIPEKSTLFPALTNYDMEQLFQSDMYAMHPEFGLYKLADSIDLVSYVKVDGMTDSKNTLPAYYLSVSGQIGSFSIAAAPKESLKEELEITPKKEKFEDKPLSFVEKLRLQMYRKVLLADGANEGEVRLNSNAASIQKLAKRMGFSGDDWNEKIMQDFNNLEERNKREVDKLLELLKKNPSEALRYAIPLEEHGYTRGETSAEFRMQDRGWDFSLFKGLGAMGGAGGTVNLGDEYMRLRQQYVQSAQVLKKQGAYEEAAFVYMKLLKDYQEAASTMREGKRYDKAALIYLDYVKNESLAAACYEEGKMYEEAIRIYDKTGQDEKVGDLQNLLGKRRAANRAYRRQIEKDIVRNNYIKAAKISKNKMLDINLTQEILMKGWHRGAERYQCLRGYIDNIVDAQEAWEELQRINRDEVHENNEKVFLNVLRDEYAKQDENRLRIRDLAYEMLADMIESRRASAHELISFNQDNARLRADTLRYELKKNNRRV